VELVAAHTGPAAAAHPRPAPTYRADLEPASQGPARTRWQRQPPVGNITTMPTGTSAARRAIAGEMDQAREAFHRLLDHATDTDLRLRSDGTKWTNEQLLFHMLFGYLITRALLILVRIFGRLPDGASKAFARLLDAAHRPFHLINHLGSCAGARVIPYAHMRGRFDEVIAALERSLERERDSTLRRGMQTPPRGTRSSPTT
jgi:hypothetical protein